MDLRCLIFNEKKQFYWHVKKIILATGEREELVKL